MRLREGWGTRVLWLNAALEVFGIGQWGLPAVREPGGADRLMNV
jgi:hypothetical protein